MGKPIAAVGTGGMGREAAAWVADLGDSYELLIFLDDDPSRQDAEVVGLPVLGGLAWTQGHLDVEVVVAVGSPQARAEVVRHLDAAGGRLVTIGPRVAIGEGAIVCPGVILTCDLTCDIRVGRAAIVNDGARVGHDVDLGDASFIAPGVDLAGSVAVEEQADVGIRASVIQGCRIGARAVVGAGAVVIRDVPSDTTVVGAPARPVGEGDRDR